MTNAPVLALVHYVKMTVALSNLVYSRTTSKVKVTQIVVSAIIHLNRTIAYRSIKKTDHIAGVT